MEVYGFIGDKRGKSGSVEQILRVLNGRLSKAAVNALLTGEADGIADHETQNASYAFHESLHLLVNTWIDTGRTQGEEHPWKRVVWPEFLQDYVARNPPLLQIGAEGPHLVLFPHVWAKRKGIAEAAKDAATALFLQLLDSPARTRLFRCDGCRAYFMRTRAPKKNTPIYHGSWCVKCKGKGGAVRTKNSRDLRTAEMIEWAADAWAQWKQGSGRSKRTEWVAQKVNERLGRSRDPIAANWVTRHNGEIETEVERRNHAKG